MSVHISGRLTSPTATELVHGPSGAVIGTVAPKDNGGDGSRFSPTDLCTASLAACVCTTMSLVATRSGIPLDGVEFTIEKHMTAEPPRRIAKLVARYRIRAGRRIGSAALTADGIHARTDALTSLVVVAAGIGALFGQRWADPVAGLVVALFILLMLRHSAVRIFARMLDAVDPELVDLARTVVGAVPGVRQVGDLRLRWHGHQLQALALVAVDPRLTVEQGHLITQQVEHDLMHAFPYSVHAVVHLDPHGVAESHRLTQHHL